MKTICVFIFIIAFIMDISASPTFDKLFGQILTELYDGGESKAREPYYYPQQNHQPSQQYYQNPQQQYQYSQNYQDSQQHYQRRQQHYQNPQQGYQYSQQNYQQPQPYYVRPIYYNGYYDGQQQQYQQRAPHTGQQNSYKDICRMVNANGFTNPGGIPKCPY